METTKAVKFKTCRVFLLIVIIISFLMLPKLSHGQVDPRFDVISGEQYDLLRQTLLNTKGVLSQRWGNNSPVNKFTACGGSLKFLHAGVDFAENDPDAPVYSATAGKVIEVRDGQDCTNFKKCNSLIRIFNSVIRKTFVYLHLVPEISEEQFVVAGERIGTVAARGAGSPHLHFQVNVVPTVASCINKTVNPYEAVFPPIYASSFSGGTITRIDSGTGAKTIIVSDLSSPEDMTTDEHGRVYVVENNFEAGTSRIERLNPDGSHRRVIDTKICGPEGLSFDASGNLFVNTRQRPCAHSGIWKIKFNNKGRPVGNPENVVPAFSDFGEGTAFLMSGPFAGDLIAAGSLIEGEFTVAASLVRSEAPKFGPSTLFVDLPEDVPVGLAVDSKGDVFVTSAFNGTVLQYDPIGVSKGIFAMGLQRPHFIEFDGGDNLYVAENALGAVLKIKPDGSQSVLAEGISDVVGIGLGPQSAALLISSTNP